MDSRGLMVYKCPKCGVYFEAYSQAFKHLKLKHDLKVKSVETVRFTECQIPVQRTRRKEQCREEEEEVGVMRGIPLSSHHPSSSDNEDKKTNEVEPLPPRLIKGTKVKVKATTGERKGDGRVEIKLDDLKASEIETLMEDLYETERRTRTRRTRKPVLETPRESEAEEDEGPLSPVSSSSSSLFEVTTRKSKRARKKKIRDASDSDYNDDNEVKDRNIRYRCRLCPKTFNTHQRKFIDHMRANHLQNGVYPCPREGCGRTFTRIRNLNKHPHVSSLIKLRNGELYGCHCGQEFVHPCQLNTHINEVHQQRTKDPKAKPKSPKPKVIQPQKRTYTCPLCPKSFDILCSLRRHFILHLENNPFVCKISGCGKKFNSRSYLKSHIQLHIGEKRYKCDKCSFAYVRYGSFLQHVRTFHEDRTFKRTFTKPKHKVKRVETEVDFTRNEEGPAADNKKVKEEDEDFLRIEVGSQHFDDTNLELVETPSEPEPSASTIQENPESDSEEGEEKSQELLDLMPSLDNGQGLRTITLNDPVYKKLLVENPKAAAQVLWSRESVSGYSTASKNKFKCSLCNWEAVQRHQLGLHMKRIHNQDLDEIYKEPSSSASVSVSSATSIMLICSKCGHSCSSPDDLTAHMNKEHPTKHPYPCNFCCRRFANPEALKEHKDRIHFSEKKYTCPHCPARYAVRPSLHAHIETCHKDVDVMCHLCSKRLTSRIGLQRHKTKCHKGETERLECKLCGQTFVGTYTLERHVASVHLGVKSEDYRRLRALPKNTPPEQDNVANDPSQILGL